MTLHDAGPEELVEQAERAIKAGNAALAEQLLWHSMLQARRYDFTARKLDWKDRHAARTSFATAALLSLKAQTLKGPVLVQAVLEAIKHVISGLEVAQGYPRYGFLVYNATVSYWHVSRPLQTSGLRQHLLPSQEKICQALEKVDGQVEWRVRHLINLALCQTDSGKPEDAVKTLARAAELATQQGLAIKQDVVALQYHLSAAQAKAAGKPPPARPAAAAVPKGKVAEGTPPTVDEDFALALTQWVLSVRPEPAVATQALKDALAKVDPPAGTPNKGPVSLRAVSRIAWAAAQSGNTDMAQQCASRAAASQEVGPRTWADLTRLQLSHQTIQPLAAPPRDGSAGVVSRVRVLEQLDEVVTSFMRLKDVEGIHHAARLIWNAGLPLLQPELRHHVKRSFTAAARALDAIASPLHRLRAQLHVETARCEVADESLVKAEQEARRALALDYVAPPDEVARFKLERPLDRQLVPLWRGLQLKMGLGEEASGPEEAAMALLERAKDSRNPAIRADYLHRAMQKLRSLPLLQPPASDGSVGAEAAAELQLAARSRTELWADLCRAAWSSKLSEVVLRAAPYVLAANWTPEVDREMVRLKAEVQYLEVQACLATLASARQEVVPPLQASPATVGEDGVRLPPTTAEQLQQLVGQGLTTCMSLALSAGEPWLVHNAAAVAWNAHLPVLRAGRPVELRELLHGVLHLLLQLDATDLDGSLLNAVAQAHARAVEHHYLLQLLFPPTTPSKESTPPAAANGAAAATAAAPATVAVAGVRYSVTEAYELLPQARAAAQGINAATALSASAKTELTNMLTAAATACERALSKVGAAQPQSLIEAYARLQQLRGVAVALPPGVASTSEQTSKVLNIIQTLSGSAASPTDTAAATKLDQELQTAMQLLNSFPGVNVELWAKLARAAADRGLWAGVIDCATAAVKLLPMQPAAVESTADAPDLLQPQWFWLAVLESSHGQAIMAMLKLDSQEPGTQLQIRRQAIGHFVTAMRFSGFAHKADLCEAAARQLWNAALPFGKGAAIKCALIRSLQEAVAALHAVIPADTKLQVSLCCLLLECLAEANQWQQVSSSCEEALTAVPRSEHGPLIQWKAACLAHTGLRVQEAMTRMRAEYPPEVAAAAYLCLARHSSNSYDQMAARRAAVDAVASQPSLRLEYLLELAGWLYHTGHVTAEALKDVLLQALSVVLELDAPPGEGTSGIARTFSRRKGEAQHAAVAEAAEATVGGRRLAPDELQGGAVTGLTVRELDAAIRLFVMLSYVVTSAHERTEYALAAHAYAVRMLTQGVESARRHQQAVVAAATAAAAAPPTHGIGKAKSKKLNKTAGGAAATAAGGGGASAVSAAAAAAAAAQDDATSADGSSMAPPMPYALSPQDPLSWSEFRATPALSAGLATDSGPSALRQLAQPALSVATLDTLMEQLCEAGYLVHCVPLCRLQQTICAFAAKSKLMAVAVQYKLLWLFDQLGRHTLSASLELELQQEWRSAEAQQELTDSRRQAAILKLIPGGMAAGARPRSAMAVGRLAIMNRRSRPGTADDAAVQPPPIDGTDLANSIVDAALTEMNGASSSPATPVTDGITQSDTLNAHYAMLRVGKHSKLQPAVAQHLLQEALDLARAHGDKDCEAHCLQQLAELQLLRNAPEAARQLLDSALAHGGDVQFWLQGISLYAKVLIPLPNEGREGATKMLREGVALLRAVVRSNRLRATEAGAAVAQLQLLLAELHLQPEISDSGQRRGDRQPVQRDGDAAAELAAAAALVQGATQRLWELGRGAAYVDALLLQVDVMQRQLQPEAECADQVRQLQTLLQLVKLAEEHALQLAHTARQVGLPTDITLPSSHQLARVQCRAAQLHLDVAATQQRGAEAEAIRARPSFPAAPGKASDAVTRFIDETNEKVHDPWMRHEELALLSAVSACANAARCPQLQGTARCLAGESRMFQFYAAAARELQPWQPLPAAAAPELAKLSDEGGAADGTAGPPDESRVAADSASNNAASAQGQNSQPAVQELASRQQSPRRPNSKSTKDAAGQKPASPVATKTPRNQPARRPGKQDAVADAAAAAAAAAADAASAETEPVLEGSAAVRGTMPAFVQGVAELRSALALGLAQQHAATIYRAAMALTESYGLLQPDEAARYLCIAQSVASAAHLQRMFADAAAPDHWEVLAARQMEAVRYAVPDGLQHRQYLQVTERLQQHGLCYSRLHLQADLNPARVLPLLPEDTRIILLHMDTEQQALVAAALNVPTTTPAGGGAVAAATAASSTEGLAAERATKTARGGHASDAPPPAPRTTLLGRMPLGGSELQSLLADIGAYKRLVRQQIRNKCVPPPEVAAPPPTTQSRAGARHGPKGNAKRIMNSVGRASLAKHPHAQDPSLSGTPAQALFDPELNIQWRALLQRIELLLAPLMHVIQGAVVQLDSGRNETAPLEVPKNSKAGKPPASRANTSPATDAKPGVCLLLDPSLAALPWEALPVLQASCLSVSRCFSLQLLLSALQQPSNGDADAATASNMDMDRMAYIVDPLHELSDSSRAAAPYSPPLIPHFREKVLGVHGSNTWQGITGAPQRQPDVGEYAQLLRGAGVLLYQGLGRMLSYVGPKVISNTDLSRCGAALIFDRVDHEEAFKRQSYLDNRKNAAELRAEGPTEAVALLLLRGVRCVVLNTCTTTAQLNTEMVAMVLDRIKEGASVGEAVHAVRQEVKFELENAPTGTVIYGLAHLVGAGTVKGKGGLKKK